jgi:hypothetical protein
MLAPLRFLLIGSPRIGKEGIMKVGIAISIAAALAAGAARSAA